ncbi:MAG: peptidoglycan DD-metalloendopeptidase family protein [Solobacterium sp.]|nr:peptidoglycan DD-metalloendopeptidase family protein [Solobacterium sp.]MBR2727297.1 peptidoglycan DD-metalloendopeptidase family protein [Solobacterium sp.]
MKKLLAVILSLIAAVAIAVFVPFSYRADGEGQTDGIVAQEVLEIRSDPAPVWKVYSSGELVGVLKDRTSLDRFLKKVYKEDYEADYPDASLSLGKDVYLAQEQTNMVYEDKDEEILEWLRKNRLFTVSCTSVQFSDENGVYAEIYVLNEAMYQEAMNEYLSLFLSREELTLLMNGQQTQALRTYGSRAVGISVLQTITVSDAYAPVEEILQTKEAILDYIEYSGNTDREYYTVQKYDTVAGVGSKNNGLSATQVMNINRDKILSTDQILAEGEELCVTYFTPIIDVVVRMESMRKETIFAETVYTEDNTMRMGVQEELQAGVNGSKNSLYSERWINGVLVSGELISSVDTAQPVNQVIAVGTLEIPGVGTGQYRWPVDNPLITCGWGCYTIPHFHLAIDVVNRYERYGKIYAADRGVIAVNSYDGISGNYVFIDHNNGMMTYYGHMNMPSPLPVGTIVDKGDVIGQIGMTGRASGPHTHFYIMIDGKEINPCDGYLDCEAIK